MAASTMVGTAKKKKKKTVQFGFHVFVDDEKVEKMKKMKNVMKKFYENFTFYEKVPSHLDPFRVFFFLYFYPDSGVMFSTDLHYSICST